MMKTTYELAMCHEEGPRRVDSFLWSGVTKIDQKVPAGGNGKMSLLEKKKAEWAAQKESTWQTAYKNQYLVCPCPAPTDPPPSGRAQTVPCAPNQYATPPRPQPGSLVQSRWERPLTRRARAGEEARRRDAGDEGRDRVPGKRLQLQA
jgi:hypothetical protein